MKWFVAISVAVLFATSGSVFADTGQSKAQLHVIFLGWYEKEPVELYSSNQKIYASVITTEPTSGIAAHAEVSLVSSAANLKVYIPRLKLTKVRDFNLVDGKFLYVSLLKNELSFQQTQAPLALD